MAQKPSQNQVKTINQTESLPEWIQFDAETYKFVISPPDSAWRNNYIIIVNASNGVLSQTQSFSFTVNVSWMFILKMIAQIVGPLGTLLTFYVYRVYIYAFFFKSWYKYLDFEHAFVNEPYEKKIFLIRNDLDNAHRLWKLIKPKFKNKTKLLMEPGELPNAIKKARSLMEDKSFFSEEDILPGTRLYQIIEAFTVQEAIKEIKMFIRNSRK